MHLISLFAALSVIGCILNIIFTVLIKKMFHPIGKMVIHFSICDILVAFPLIILLELGYMDSFDTFQDDTSLYLYCIFYFFRGLGGTGTIIWACCFAHALYHHGKEGNGRFLSSQLLIYLKISYLMAVISGIGHSAYWFYWKTNPEALILKLYIGFDTALASICCLVSLGYIGVGLKLVISRGTRIPWDLLSYPMILLFCNVPIRVFYLCDHPSSLEFSESLFLLQGLLNALAYGLINRVKEASRGQCCRNSAQESSLQKEEENGCSEMHLSE
jgi:hypothetical protein